MRKRYSFSSRRTGQARDPKNIRKQKQKFPIVVQKVLNKSDIILQILDARFIKDTRNLELETNLKELDKIVINVMNKSDLITKNQIKDLPKEYILVSCKERRGVGKLRDQIKRYASKIKKPLDKQGKITVGIIGYPNTGKSSLINLLIGKKSAKTGAEAGFTKGLQKLKLTTKIMLLDSPGVIPKKEYTSIENTKLAKHAQVGARTYSQVKDPETIIFEMMKAFPNTIQKHYKIKTQSSEHLLEKLGRQKNLLKKGNQVNFDKTARLILKDWQDGKIKL